MKSIKIAIFASGTGSNAKNIIQYFKNHPKIRVEFILSNKTDAPIVEWAKNNNVECFVFSNLEVNDGLFVTDFCKKRGIEAIILAGYLRKIPSELIHDYPNKIINIHPALLPKYGGKGMYGVHVHEAVKQANEQETGITIHFVNEHFDEGKHIAQFKCTLNSDDTIESISKKINGLEIEHFPKVIESILNK